MKSFGGPVLFLDRADINTDEIIPARYLTEISKEALAPHLLEDLKLAGFDPKADGLRKAREIVARANFGCGSSREHAPWALEANGITAVIAPSFARIFRQNMFNCGLMAIDVEETIVDRLFAFPWNSTNISIDLNSNLIRVEAGDEREEMAFQLGGFDRTLVESEGWVGFAASRY